MMPTDPADDPDFEATKDALEEAKPTVSNELPGEWPRVTPIPDDIAHEAAEAAKETWDEAPGPTAEWHMRSSSACDEAPGPPIPIIGGPLDGAHGHLDEQLRSDWKMVDLLPPNGLEEPYVIRSLTDSEDGVVEWWLVWSPLVKVPDRDPDVEHMRATHEAAGSTLLTIPCAPGEHEWGPWRPTAGGNHIRTCPKCNVSQGRVV